MVSSVRIRDIAKYINSVEKGLELFREVSNHEDIFIEARGAYFAALKVVELAGIQNQVYEAREKLKNV